MAPVSVSEAVNGETSIWLRIKLLIFLVTGLDSAVFMYLQTDRMLWKKRLSFDRLLFTLRVLYNMHTLRSIGAIVSVSLTLWLLFHNQPFFPQMWGGITRHGGRLQGNSFAEHNSNIGILVFRAGVCFFSLCNKSN